MNVEDIVDINQTQARYGYLMDDLAWDRIDEVFSPDCVFDASVFGLAVGEGFAGVRAVHEAGSAPLTHHATNVLVESLDGGTAVVRSKALGTYTKGRAFSGEYRDTMVKTADGWRIQRRVVVLREPATTNSDAASAS